MNNLHNTRSEHNDDIADAAGPADAGGANQAKNDRPGTPEPSQPAVPSSDPFEPVNLRMAQNFAGLGVKKLTNTVPVRKPAKENWFMTRDDPAYWLVTGAIELKEDRETYLVAPELWHELASEATFGPRMLITSVTRQGVLFLWPIRLPGQDGRIDEWNRSAMEAAETARKSWVRVQANMNLGAYETSVAKGITAEPEFPDLTMAEILRIAFKDRYIDSLDHPVLRRLRGEV
jgi:hypothetical protein